jgi:hypothetical protein
LRPRKRTPATTSGWSAGRSRLMKSAATWFAFFALSMAEAREVMLPSGL